MNRLYLGVDPGSSKTGTALLDAEGRILAVAVLSTEKFEQAILAFLEQNKAQETLRFVILGNGTTSETMRKRLVQLFPRVELRLIDESHSTEEARKVYWQVNPPHGWRKLLPLGIQTPPQNMDGYAAAVLVRRFLKQFV